jgi:hypothetical protein
MNCLPSSPGASDILDHSTAPKKASAPSVSADNDASSHNGSKSKGNGSAASREPPQAARAANPGHFLCAESRTEEEDTQGSHRGAHPGATREAVQTPGLPEKEGSAQPAGAGGSQSVNGAAKAAIAALRNMTMMMDDQDSLKEKLDAQAQKLTPAAPRELIKCLVGLCDKYGLEVEATGLRLAARHASQSCAVAHHGHQQQGVSVSTPLVLHQPTKNKNKEQHRDGSTSSGGGGEFVDNQQGTEGIGARVESAGGVFPRAASRRPQECSDTHPHQPIRHPPSPAKALCTSLPPQPLPQARPQPLPPSLAEARCTNLVYEPDPVTISARLSYTTALSSTDLKLDEYEQVDQDGAQVERIVVDCLNSDPRFPPPFPRSSPSSSSSSSSFSQSSPLSSSSSSAKRRVGIAVRP